MAKRIKLKPVAEIQTREEMEHLVGEIVQLQIHQNGLKLAIDTQIAEIRKQHEGSLDRLSKTIDEKVSIAEAWAASNPGEFGKKKSIDFVHAVVGYRSGTPKVKKLSKFKTFAAVAAFMQSLPWAKKYVSVAEPAVNKEALIRDRTSLTAQQLSELGLAIVQDETFFISPKSEKLEQGVSI